MNTRIPRKFCSPLVMVLAAAGIWIISPPLHAVEMQVGRYSVLPARPTVEQADLLSAVVTVRFQEPVRTVGEAVHHLLQDSGYRLAEHHGASLTVLLGLPLSPGPVHRAPPRTPHGASLTVLLGLPLPGVHRNLGPLTLRQALETLAGPVFRLVQDPVHRLVSFELCTPPTAADPADSGVQTKTPGDGEGLQPERPWEY